jgi:hypothetical protein
MKSSVKRLMNDVMTINETSLALVPARKGAYDKAVEIYVDGEFKITYLSQVRVGQPWHLADGPNSDKWFVCVSPIKVDYSRDSKNPTFIMGAITVLQAAPIEDPTPTIEYATKAQVPKLTYSVEDVQDV